MFCLKNFYNSSRNKILYIDKLSININKRLIINNSDFINNEKNNLNKINKFNFSSKTFLEDILPDHLFYDIPKYSKNPENFEFPWLVGGAPFLELKVIFVIFK